jgi:hypothetical protein
MPTRSTGLTPFFLVYGAEAILPSDVQYDSPRVEAYEEEDAEASRQLSMDLLEEERDLAAQRSAINQPNLRRYHSRRVRKRSFKAGGPGAMPQTAEVLGIYQTGIPAT